MLRGTWFVIISPVLAGQARGPHYCIRNPQAAIGHPRLGHFTTSHHLPDLLMTTDKDKKKAIYDSAILAVGWTSCIFRATCQETQGLSGLQHIFMCVCRQQEKTVCVCVSELRRTPVGHDLYVIFLSKGLTFIEKALPRLTETQSFGYLKNLQFRVMAGLKCFLFFFLTVGSPNTAFFQMNEKLCKWPGALTYSPPVVTSCQLINQMSPLLCLH